MSQTAPLTPRVEPALACACCAAVAAALLGAHVADGGRYLDDWWLSAYIHFPTQLGFSSPASYLSFYSGARPAAVGYWLASYWLFGLHYAWHRALGVALTAALGAVFYALLRELGLARRDAAAIAALSLVLPVADSIHFWATPDVAQLCLAAFLAGALLALRGLRAQRLRDRVALSVAARGLYLASVLIAETTVPYVGLTWLLYRTRAGGRRATRAWIPDAALAGVISLHYVARGNQRAAGRGSGGYVHHAGVLANQALTLVAGTLAPFARSRAWVLLLLVALGAWIVLQSQRRGAPALAAIRRRWLAVAAIAIAFAALSYSIYVPSDAGYQPLVPGIGNRINIGLLLPLSALAFAIARLLAGVLSSARAAGALTAALWAMIAVGGVRQLEADRTLWDAAAGQQRTVLAALHRALPSPPPGAALLVLGAPGVTTRFERVGIASVNVSAPVFSTWWELDAAVKLSYGRSDLSAYPIWAFQPAQLACGPHAVYQLGLDEVRHVLAYGDSYLVDVGRRSATLLRDELQCARLTARAQTIRYDLPV